MSEQARTYFDQARMFARRGDPGRALDLLRRAKLLAEADPVLKLAILRELVAIADLTRNAEELEAWREQLATLEQAGVAGVQQAVRAKTGHARTHAGSLRWWIAGTLATALVAAVGGLWAAGVIHIGFRERSLPPATQPMSPGAGPSQAPKLPDAPAALGTGQRGALGTTPSRYPRPGGVEPVPTGMAAAREQRWSQNIGLLVWLQRYEGIVDGQTVSVEFPLTTGTAFAVAKAGLMLSNRHVTSARDGFVPDDLSALGLPLLRSGKPALKVCFGADPSLQLDAKVLHESPDFDLAIVQVQREFAAPFTLSQGQIARTDTVVALGYPGAVIELSQAGNPGHARQQLLAAMKSGQFRWLEFLPPDAFDFVATTGVVSAANRSMDGALYHMFDAKVAPGNSGGPLVASSTGEVVGIVTIGGTGPDASGYNFALALPQVRQELGRYLP